MRRSKEQIQRDTRKLVKAITKFDESDENFKLCISYVESNFKYHRYLSPDSHKIHRSIDGLCEKFEVHSQQQKALDLRDLTTAFLEQPGLDQKEIGKTDVHYALLSLLINLAETPTKVDFHRKIVQPIEEKFDDFDWKKYLLDDDNLDFMSFASSDSDENSLQSDSETESTSGGLGNPNNRDQQKDWLPDKTVTELSPRKKQADTDRPHYFLESCLPAGACDEYDYLAARLTVEYWKGKGKEEDVAGNHTASNLAKDWMYYQKQKNEFHTPRAQTVVTERQVIREVLWMLSGITEVFIFQYSDKAFRLNPDVYMTHLTTECMESAVRPLMRKASQVVMLQSFVSDMISQFCSSIAAGDGASVPQTYQSFACCVSSFLSDFRCELQVYEKIVMKQEEIISLEKLYCDLQPWLNKVQAVHGVCIKGIVSVASLKDGDTQARVHNSRKVALLLNTLYQAVFESSLTSVAGEEFNVLLDMLLKSSEPLIRMTSDWITNGQLIDPAGEFMVQRNRKILSLDETFWEKSIVPNTPGNMEDTSATEQVAPPDSSKGPSSGNKSSSNQTTSSKASRRSVSCQVAPPSQAQEFLRHSPKLLQPVIGDVVLTGKSMELLESLGRMGDMRDTSHSDQRTLSLNELFLRDLKKKLDPELDDHSPELDDHSPLKHSDSSSWLCDIPGSGTAVEELLNIPGDKDTLLAINFDTLFPASSAQTWDLTLGDNQKLSGRLHDHLAPSLLRLFDDCLYPHVRSRCRAVCCKLVEILKSEYHLMDCIHAMQRYYLMSSGEVMSDFYTPIFQKIMNKEFWRSSAMLELYLHEAVTVRFPEDVARLTVTVNSEPSQKEKKVINLTDSIRLHYKVPWPVDVVISSKCQELYNEIFSFLLQIKGAKYSMDQLRFEDLSRLQVVPTDSTLPDLTSEPGDEMSRATRLHQCQLLRFRLLYFINSLHNYIMTRILHSTGLEFSAPLEEATDLEQIICIHRKYVDAIHERCLLHQGLAFLKEAVVNVLNLSLTFCSLWRQGVDFIRTNSVQDMEAELTRCIHFLSAFLNNAIKRGSFPHLEPLAFALISSLPRANR